MVVSASEQVTHDGSIAAAFFGADGNLVSNDWKGDQNGEGFERQVSATGRSDILGWSRAVLAPRIYAVLKDFSDRYDWGSPGKRPETTSTESEAEIPLAFCPDQTP